jgi:hypothetical protein
MQFSAFIRFEKSGHPMSKMQYSFGATDGSGAEEVL